LKLSVFSVHLKYIIGSCNCISTTNISYAYDALGQLIRVNDETDTTSGATGTTWTYEYDRGGNIISKSRYAFTTGALGTALETIVYGYGDYNWMDKMTHYNYLGVSYDDIGNPTSFNGWNCTWEKGRQLKQMTDNSVNTIYYKYNADGLRVQKRKVTIYGSDVTTNYILHGKNIVHMTQGTDTLHFWYDAQGRPAIVEFNGTKYAYIHNLQGDIVGIIDSTGAEVVQYTYDAWGKVLSTAGTLASTLGTVQPFRYRGYVYDVETGLYYLRSRYYNPEWGRFINADSVLEGNGFSYCVNKPVSAIDTDGNAPSFGYYHFLVQTDFIISHPGVVMELGFYKYGDKNKIGRADLVNPITGEVWEVKPHMYGFFRNPDKYTEKARKQLESYIEGEVINGNSRHYMFGSFHPGRMIPEKIIYDPVTYMYIAYWSEGDGIIWYDVFPNITVPETIAMPSREYSTTEQYAAIKPDEAVLGGIVFVLSMAASLLFGIPAYNY